MKIKNKCALGATIIAFIAALVVLINDFDSLSNKLQNFTIFCLSLII